MRKGEDRCGEYQRRMQWAAVHAAGPAASASADRRQAGQRQSSVGKAGIGMRALSSMHQQPPSLPPVPHSNAPPQRAQMRLRKDSGGREFDTLMSP